jgi:tetratricopeptide (TPR) repeat protein
MKSSHLNSRSQSTERSQKEIGRFHLLVKELHEAETNVVALRRVLERALDAEEFGIAREVSKRLSNITPDEHPLTMAWLRIDAALAHERSTRDAVLERLQDYSRNVSFSGNDWLQASAIFERLHRLDLAIDAMKFAKLAGMDSVTSDRRIAYAHYFRRDFKSAATVLEELLSRTDLQWAQMREFADLAYKAGYWNLSLRYARKMQALFPNDIGGRVTEAVFLARAGDRRLAVELIRPSILQIEQTPRKDIREDAREILSGFAQFGSQGRPGLEAKLETSSFQDLVTAFDNSGYTALRSHRTLLGRAADLLRALSKLIVR